MPTPSLHSVRPHVKYFIFYNLLYFTPIAWVAFYEFHQNAISEAAAVNWQDLRRVAFLYGMGCICFCLGSAGRSFLAFVSGKFTTESQDLPLRATSLGWSGYMALGITLVMFLASKILLIPLGVYSSYAFDTGQMEGGLWSASMMVSELLVLFSLAALFSRSRRNVFWFAVLAGINAINLLHGTRIFFIVTVLGFSLYLSLEGKLNWKILGLGLAGVAVLAYVVFVLRTPEESFTSDSWTARLAVPIMAESVFSQLSLLSVVRDTHLWNAWGALPQLIHDLFYFTLPRLLAPNKDAILFIDNYSDLSPLGAFSGYAQGLIYFGYLLPLVYFTFGALADWLACKARFSRLWALLYVYYTCDFLFRIMRDGYIIPAKMLLDSVIVLAAIHLAELLFPQPEWEVITP
jgi:hypothetical protein